MTILPWKTERNLENSLAEFLQNTITTQNLKVINLEGSEVTPEIRVGFKAEADWNLPVISLYVDNNLAPRLSIGSNCRQDSYLIIIDIRALDSGMQKDLTDWIKETINDGWDFNEYVPNPLSPDNPTKTKTGYVSFDYITNTPVRFGENVDLLDRYRQNITISCTIT